ncbi:MAG: SRPBCC domain-containing protein [Planctomycetota bacterium]
MTTAPHSASPRTTPLPMIRLHKHVRATRQRVYEALTTPEQFPHWFAPGPNEKCGEVIVEPWVGGRFRFEMTDAKGEQHVGVGTFTEVVEHEKLSYSWTWENNPDFGGNSQVTFELFNAENHIEPGQPATEIVLTHEKLPTAAERSEHTGGWWNCLRALGYHVRGVDPREAMYGAVASS